MKKFIQGEFAILGNDDYRKSKADSRARGTKRPSLTMDARWVPSVLVAAVAFAMSGCGARSSLPVPPIFTNPVAYVSNQNVDTTDTENTNNTSNIWIINPDSVPSALTTGTATQPIGSPASAGSPVWSPNGKMIAFTSAQALEGNGGNAAFNIWVMNANGSNQRPLTRATAMEVNSIEPVWSPDGTKIAFVSALPIDPNSESNDNFNIWVVNVDGSAPHPQPLTIHDDGTDSGYPTWSPDGSQIAFASHQSLDVNHPDVPNDVYNIWVMNPDGTNLQPLTNSKVAESVEPVWQPHGNQIAFTSGLSLDPNKPNDSNGPSNIWVMNPDGTKQQALTKLMVDSRDPVWSHDGKKIAYVSRAPSGTTNVEDFDIENVWVMNADGSQQVVLTEGGGQDPTWSPDNFNVVFAAGNIWMTTADGSGTPRNLTNLNNATCSSPSAKP